MLPVRAFMAHHQGMILVSIANVLKDAIFRTCFHSIPSFRRLSCSCRKNAERTRSAAARSR